MELNNINQTALESKTGEEQPPKPKIIDLYSVSMRWSGLTNGMSHHNDSFKVVLSTLENNAPMRTLPGTETVVADTVLWIPNKQSALGFMFKPLRNVWLAGQGAKLGLAAAPEHALVGCWAAILGLDGVPMQEPYMWRVPRVLVGGVTIPDIECVFHDTNLSKSQTRRLHVTSKLVMHAMMILANKHYTTVAVTSDPPLDERSNLDDESSVTNTG